MVRFNTLKEGILKYRHQFVGLRRRATNHSQIPIPLREWTFSFNMDNFENFIAFQAAREKELN